MEIWSKENKMIINKKKSGIIIHKKRRTKNKKGQIKEIEGIPICKKYKYLGIIINEPVNAKD